jgi:thiol:disulfide interchange protein
MNFKILRIGISKTTAVLLASATLSLSLIGSISMSAGAEEQGSQTSDGSSPAAEGLNWHKDFDSALVEAKEQQKFVLVDVYTDWCVYCKKLDKEVYTDPAVKKYLSEHFIVVKANAEDKGQGEAFCSKFDAFGAYPTLLFFDSKSTKEKPVARIAGYLAPTEFNAALHSIVESKKYKQKRSK